MAAINQEPTGLFGVSFGIRKVQSIEVQRGVKGVSFGIERRQPIEAQKGVKGVSFGIEYKGQVIITTHYERT